MAGYVRTQSNIVSSRGYNKIDHFMPSTQQLGAEPERSLVLSPHSRRLAAWIFE